MTLAGNDVPRTFSDLGGRLLWKVCHAVGMTEAAGTAVSTFRTLLAPWGEKLIAAKPEWPSNIVDDHTPFEISVTVGSNRSEVRVLVEAQGDEPTLRCQQQAGRELTSLFERELGADLSRLRLIEDLFLPSDPQGIFAIWHAVSFRDDGELDLKVYLNLQAQGRERAPAIAEEALRRLGFTEAMPLLREVAGRRGFELDELLYFSLDLAKGPHARVKVYFRHHRPTAADLEHALALSPGHAPGEIRGMCRALGGGDGPFTTRAPVSCFSYVTGDTTRPSQSTIYFPITGYVTDDLEAKAKISAYLTGLGASASAYQAAVDAFTSRPLDKGVGMQSYVSFRTVHGAPRTTIYFGPEAYSVQPPRPRAVIELAKYRSRFPLLDERLYFASQCMGPTPADMFDDLEDYRRSLLLRKRAIPQWVERVAEVTTMTEQLLNAPTGSIALRDSATAAQSAIAAALEPRPGRDRIVISRHDFHSTRYLWAAQQRRGFKLDMLEPGGAPVLSAEDYIAAIREDTAVVTAPLVSPRTGAMLDVPAIVRAARARGALVVIDAYQAVGVVPIDVQELDADVVVGGMHKWLGGGGSGLAFLYVRPSLADRLLPAYPGWFGSGESIMEFAEDYVPGSGARRFQQGTIPIEPIYTSRAGLRVALDAGVHRIRERSLELTGRMIERFESRGIAVTTPRRSAARGGMVCIDVPNGEAIETALGERGIDVDFRPGAGIRIAPHFCHRDDECDRVVDAIADLVKA